MPLIVKIADPAPVNDPEQTIPRGSPQTHIKYIDSVELRCSAKTRHHEGIIVRLKDTFKNGGQYAATRVVRNAY